MNQEYNRFGRRIATITKMNLRPLDFYDYECPECNGEGTIEYGPICYKPASMCCGGCYQETTCEVCSGDGIMELDNPHLWRLYDILMRLEIRPHTTQKTHDMISGLIDQELKSRIAL